MSLQGLELLVAVLLARNRQPPPAVAAGVPHAEFAAGLVSLPSDGAAGDDLRGDSEAQGEARGCPARCDLPGASVVVPDWMLCRCPMFPLESAAS